MSDISKYRIKDDSDHFILVKKNTMYYIKDIRVTRPDWDYIIEVSVATRNGNKPHILYTVPLSENEFVGKTLSEILENYLDGSLYVIRKWNHESVNSKTTTNENLLLIL